MSRTITAHVRRRIEFLLAEAGSDDSEYDHAVIYTLRTLTNVLTYGEDLDSSAIKRKTKRMSQRAFELRASLPSFEEWCKETRNDHPDPLKQVWDWLRANATSLSVPAVAARLAEHPIVVVTKKEHDAMPSSSGSPHERYNGIEIIDRPDEFPDAEHWPRRRRIGRNTATS